MVIGAQVVGGGISILPQEDLSNLFGGAGEVLQAINQSRQQSADKQKLDDFNRVLLGDTLPADQAGPTRPGITDPQERLNAALGLATELELPQNQNRALEFANILQKAIPTTGKSLTQNAIFTRPDGTQVKIKATQEQIAANPNLELTPVTKEIPGQFKVIEDPITEQPLRVDLLDPGAEPVPFGGGVTQPQATAEDITTQPQITTTTERPRLTKETLELGTGPASGLRQFFNKALGFLPGTIAPKTAEAKQRIGLFNQNLKTRFINNPKFPVAEQQIVAPLLLQDNFFDDPQLNPQRLSVIRDTLEGLVEGKQNRINAGNMTRDQLQKFTDQINDINITLDEIPTRAELGGQPASITLPQIQSMSQSEAQSFLDNLSSQDELNALSREAKIELDRKLRQ